MRRPTCCGFWSILTITILKFPAVEASSLSAENWPFANGASDANANANDIFDLNAPGEGEEDWTFSDILGNNPFAAGQGEGDDAVAIASSGIYQLPDTTTTTIFNLDDDNHQLFMDNDEDGDGPPQTNANAEWLADLGPQPNNEQEGEEKEEKEECSSSDLPGKKRLARRNGICSPSSSSSSSSSSFSRGSAGPVHSNPRVSITEASTFDQQNCPTGSYKIKSLFVCSSPEVSKSVASVPPTWTLYDSQRGKQASFLFLLFLLVLPFLSFSFLTLNQTRNSTIARQSTVNMPCPLLSPSLFHIFIYVIK